MDGRRNEGGLGVGTVVVNNAPPPEFIAHKTGEPDYWHIYKLRDFDGERCSYQKYGPLELTILTSEAAALDVVDSLTKKTVPEGPVRVGESLREQRKNHNCFRRIVNFLTGKNR